MRKRKARKIGVILACVWCFVLAGIVVTELLSQQPSKRPAAAEHPGNASVSVSKETKQAPAEPESTGNTAFETEETEEIRTEETTKETETEPETTKEPETEPETTKEPETEPPRPSETVPPPTQPVVVPTAPAVTPVAGDGIIICLDAGHKPGGGISEKEPNGPGSDVMKAKLTTGTKGAVDGVVYYEYNVNQQVTDLLKTELESRGYRVVCVDRNLSNAERALQANASGASVFIRIHCNGSSNTSVHGAQTYSAAPGNAYLSAELIQEGQRLGNIVRQKFVEATGFRDGGALAGNDMTGINWCTVPVTIVEMGFMTNEEECRKLVDPGFQKIMAIGIANGIDTYLSR